MKHVRRSFIFAVAAVAMTFALPFFSGGRVYAQEDDAQQQDVRPNERMPGRGDGDLIGRLNLTPDQIRQIRDIRQRSGEEMRSTRQRMGRAQFDLDEAIYADTVDEAAIESRARELGSAQAAVARLRALTELRIRRVLTPEQLSLLREIRHEARERGIERTRGLRQNPSAFQQRRRPNASGPDQNGVGPGTLNSNQGGAVTPARKP